MVGSVRQVSLLVVRLRMRKKGEEDRFTKTKWNIRSVQPSKEKAKVGFETVQISVNATLACQAMLTVPIFDFQSHPRALSPSWCFLKVRVHGSCVLCAHRPALFIPNQLLFFFLTVPEWSDAPQRSWTWISFGLTQWKGQMRAPWNGSEAFTSATQGPEFLHHPEMAQTEPLLGRSHRIQEGPVGCCDLVPVPLWLKCPSAVCRKSRASNCGTEICVKLNFFFFFSPWYKYTSAKLHYNIPKSCLL